MDGRIINRGGDNKVIRGQKTNEENKAHNELNNIMRRQFGIENHRHLRRNQKVFIKMSPRRTGAF